MIRKQLRDKVEIRDAALASEILYDHFRGNLVGMFGSSVWGSHLIEVGVEEDLEYCAQIDATAIVPIHDLEAPGHQIRCIQASYWNTIVENERGAKLLSGGVKEDF
jgi:hypothetical protein